MLRAHVERRSACSQDARQGGAVGSRGVEPLPRRLRAGCARHYATIPGALRRSCSGETLFDNDDVRSFELRKQLRLIGRGFSATNDEETRRLSRCERLQLCRLPFGPARRSHARPRPRAVSGSGIGDVRRRMGDLRGGSRRWSLNGGSQGNRGPKTAEAASGDPGAASRSACESAVEMSRPSDPPPDSSPAS